MPRRGDRGAAGAGPRAPGVVHVPVLPSGLTADGVAVLDGAAQAGVRPPR